MSTQLCVRLHHRITSMRTKNASCIHTHILPKHNNFENVHQLHMPQQPIYLNNAKLMIVHCVIANFPRGKVSKHKHIV